MDTLQISRILVVFFYANLGTTNASQCMELATKPFFDIKQVVGKSWRVHYTWNMNLENMCLDMTFKNATLKITKQIYHDMYKFVEKQPNWKAATLLVTIGTLDHEILMIPDQGVAGSFLGVPNVGRDKNLDPPLNGVLSHRYFLKLLLEGSGYLIMADCTIDVTTLCSQEKLPYPAEVASVASSLPLGRGSHACINDNY